MKLDVWRVYNLLWIMEEDEDKLAFQRRYGLFGLTVMWFGTTNVSAGFQEYINNAIWETLDNFAGAYLDDVLIYGNSEEEHVEHVQWVMQRLLEA